jgi:8-oxo-dGTP pyrophosphatase MutT (NUDIX family)
MGKVNAMTDKTPAVPRPAATILLVRDNPDLEVLMVKRHHQIDFASGALVFPGGKTHDGDHDPAWDDFVTDYAVSADDTRPLRISAIREAYEEAGILLARHPDGRPFAGDERVESARAVIAADERPFIDLIREMDLRLDLDALTIFARWITPVVMPKRFDTWFYVAAAPADQLARHDGHETVDAEWIAPAEALRLADAGERTIIFPTRMNVQLLGEAANAADVVARALARPLVTVEPKVGKGPEGPTLTIPDNAGYGAVSIPMSRAN